MALVGAAVALLGAFVGAASSYIVAREQVGSEASRLRREQRIEAYSDFMLRALQFASALNEATDHRAAEETQPNAISAEERSNLDRLLSELAQAGTVVELVGSMPVVEAAVELYENALVAQNFSDFSRPEEANSQLLRIANEAGTAAIERFRAEARRDLESNRR